MNKLDIKVTAEGHVPFADRTWYDFNRVAKNVKDFEKT